jgi:hypothetical protein
MPVSKKKGSAMLKRVFVRNYTRIRFGQLECPSSEHLALMAA